MTLCVGGGPVRNWGARTSSILKHFRGDQSKKTPCMWPIALLMTWPPGSLFYSLFYSCFCCLWPLAYYGHYAHYAYRPNKQALRYNNIKYSCTLSYTLFGSIWSRQQNRPRQRSWPRQPVKLQISKWGQTTGCLTKLDTRKIWLSPSLFINMNWTPEYFLSAWFYKGPET